MPKELAMAVLFDLYGKVLGSRQQEIFEDYYDNDLSLGEIAERFGITRQGVRDYIKRAEARLLELEEELGLLRRLEEQDRAARRIIALCQKGAPGGLGDIETLARSICIWEDRPTDPGPEGSR